MANEKTDETLQAHLKDCAESNAQIFAEIKSLKHSINRSKEYLSDKIDGVSSQVKEDRKEVKEVSKRVTTMEHERGVEKQRVAHLTKALYAVIGVLVTVGGIVLVHYLRTGGI